MIPYGCMRERNYLFFVIMMDYRNFPVFVYYHV